jgi:hypothetical protein
MDVIDLTRRGKG